MLTLNHEICRPHPKNESVSTTTHAKTKSIDHQTPKKLISARTRSILIPRTKNRSLSVPTLKPSQIRSLAQKSSWFRRHYWNHVNSISTLKSSQFRCLHTKTKLISIHTLKLSVFSIPTQKPSHFRSLYWSQVNFDPHYKIKSFLCRDTKTKLISIPTRKPSLFRPPH